MIRAAGLLLLRNKFNQIASPEIPVLLVVVNLLIT
jgi:hypothetical protein